MSRGEYKIVIFTERELQEHVFQLNNVQMVREFKFDMEFMETHTVEPITISIESEFNTESMRTNNIFLMSVFLFLGFRFVESRNKIINGVVYVYENIGQKHKM